jgi:DnaK suppressor protein
MMQNHDEDAPIRELLLRQHAMLRERLQALQRRAVAAETDVDGIALSTQEEALAAMEELSRQIGEIDLALAKLGNGTYGICDGCGQVIPRRRLEVLPAAARCVACAGSSAPSSRQKGGSQAQLEWRSPVRQRSPSRR